VKSLWGVLLALSVVVAAAGCSGDEPKKSGATPDPVAPLPRVAITRDDGSLDRTCGGARRVARNVEGFLDAYNRGDRDRLESAVAPSGRFQWYWTAESGRKRGPAVTAYGAASQVQRDEPGHAEQRGKLFPYFAARHRRHERIELSELEVSRVAPRSWLPLDEEVAGIQFVMTFEADDLDRLGGRNRLASGKGAVAWFEARGVVARRLMTDNAFTYVHNRSLRELLAARQIKHLRTEPYRPQTNGKVERFHQTMGREWAYGLAYRSHRHRNRALPHWLEHYNERRPHSSLGGRPPTSRVHNLRGQDS
jgi:hypothetical protein